MKLVSLRKKAFFRRILFSIPIFLPFILKAAKNDSTGIDTQLVYKLPHDVSQNISLEERVLKA